MVAMLANSTAQNKHVFKQIPLESFGCLLGATLDEKLNCIRYSGDASGVAIYGPYIELEAGLHEFEVKISTEFNVISKLLVEIFANGTVYAKKEIVGYAEKIRIAAFIDMPTHVELRVHTRSSHFQIHEVQHRAPLRMDEVNYEILRKNQLNSVEEHIMCFTPRESKLTKIEIKTLIFGSGNVNIISLPDINDFSNLLAALGINIPSLYSILTTSSAVDNAMDVLTNGFPKVGLPLQRQMLDRGVLSIPSPFSGSFVQTADSIPVAQGSSLVPIVYEFFDNPYLFVVGMGCHWVGNPSFVWLIDRDIIITSEIVGPSWQPVQEVIVDYLCVCLKHSEALKRYRGRPHTNALQCGFINNLGHHIWNDLSGLERAVRLNLTSKIDTIYAPSHGPLNFCDLFSEDQLPKLVQKCEFENLVEQVLNNQKFLMRLTGTELDDQLALKLRNSFESMFVSQYPQRAEIIGNKLNSFDFLFYVNLRAHNKCWVEQVTGVKEIARAVYEEVLLHKLRECRVGIYLDGMGDCSSIAKDISNDSNYFIEFIDGTDVPFLETVYWAYNCDAFSAVIGSGLVPLTWLANKPGFCFSETFHLDQISWWRDVRSSSQLLLVPKRSEIRDHKCEWYSKFSLDPTTAANHVRDVVRHVLTEGAGIRT